MVAVAASPDDIAAHLTADVDLAAINEFGSCVVAGPEQAIREVTNRLAAEGIVARRVRTSHGFHSQAMDSVLAPFAEYLSTLTLHPPRIPMLSNVTGTWMTDEEATDPGRWARQIRSTVRFADELADPARRSAPGARRGRTRRQPDRVGGAHARLVGHPPRGPADAPSGAEP